MHHRRGNNHTQESLSAKDVLRAAGQQDEHVDAASIKQDTQTGWEINVHISQVVWNYYSQTVPPRCVHWGSFPVTDWLLYGSLWLQAV